MTRRPSHAKVTPTDSATALASCGLRATRQRMAVLALLRADRGHPTALEIHRRLVARHPNVSQKTVYEALDALVDVGIARRVTEGGGAVRYEARPERHDHAYCRGCGRLFDIRPSADRTIRRRAETPKGFRIDGIHVTLEGRCARCAQD
ncbi:MAG TPA: Fur family transcriptional regulator [Candidatus Binatia bacterium]|nr:Fur family transcriptional regulator [Candidatus Binatia bacterium]